MSFSLPISYQKNRCFRASVKSFYIFFIILFFNLFSGCAIFSEKSDVKIKDEKNREKQNGSWLKFEFTEGFNEEIDWYTETSVLSKSLDGISRHQIDSTRFSAQSIYKNDIEPGAYYQELKVKDKEGSIDLHDLAFPEEEETLKLRFKSDGSVLWVDSYPRHSIFYVPQIFLPSKEIKLGDTWSYKTYWINEKSGLRFNLEMAHRLSRVFSCSIGQCYEIDISASVTAPDLKKILKFQTVLEGKIIFSKSVIWSAIFNKTVIGKIKDKDRVEEESCIQSVSRDSKIKELVGVQARCSLPRQGTLSSPF